MREDVHAPRRTSLRIVRKDTKGDQGAVLEFPPLHRVSVERTVAEATCVSVRDFTRDRVGLA